MERKTSIKLNMVMSIILTASNFVFPLITYSYVTRILLAEGTGKVAFVQSILSYFSYIAALGISGYGTRECARLQNNKEALSRFVSELMSINFISTVVAYLALALSIFLVPKFQEYSMLFVVMCPSILLQTFGMEWLYRGMEKYTYITIRSIIFKIIAVILTFCMIKDSGDVLWYGAITIFTASASNVLNFFNAAKYIKWTKPELYQLKRHLKPIMVFFMSMLIITIYGHFDTTMLGFISGDNAVGIYNAGLKIKTLVLSVSTAITSVFIPRMSIYFANKQQAQFHNLLLKSLRVSLVMVFPLSVFVILNAEDILRFVCGEEFLSAENTLIILMVCVLVLTMTNLLGNQILIPKNMEKRYSQSVFIGMFINLFLNTLLIPKYGSAGAAFATLMTEAFNMFWMGWGCIEEIKYMEEHIKVLKYMLPIMIAIAAGAGTNMFAQTWEILAGMSGTMQSFFHLIICGAAFFGTNYLCLLIEKEPIIMEGKEVVLKTFRKLKKKEN